MSDYYQQVSSIKVLKIPVKLKLKYWQDLGKVLMIQTAQEQEDTSLVKAWRSVIIQIIIKINEKEKEHWQNEDKEYIINFSPAEKFALEEIVHDKDVSEPYWSMIFQQIIWAFDLFDVNTKMLGAGK